MDATAFLEHRGLVLRLAYDVTGSWADSEEIGQEVYLRWSRATEVREPRAYLARIAVNLALTTLERRRREYPGPFLPEPVETVPGVDEELARAGEVELALMVVLETLTPLERAAYLLHEVFAFSHPEIAEVLERSPAAIRQLVHRARAQVQARRPRSRPDPDRIAELAPKLLAAMQAADVEGLVDLLAADARLVSDGGGRVKAALRPLLGADKVARFLVGIMRDFPGQVSVVPAVLNHTPALRVLVDGRLDSVVWMTTDDGRIDELLIIRNPDKYAHLG